MCNLLNLWYLIIPLCLVACDSGDIVDKNDIYSSQGQVVKLTATLSGMSAWDSKYTIALAGFTSNGDYSVLQRALPGDIADGTPVEIRLNNVTEDVSTVELVVVNKLRRRIITLESLDLSDYSRSQDTIYMELGNIDVAPFSALQNRLFDVACIQCHGGNGFSSAGLTLTKGNSYGQLVDVASTRVSGKKRVVSGDANQSLLYQILSEGGENILHYNHTEVLSSQFKRNTDEVRQLIADWISKLKVEN